MTEYSWSLTLGFCRPTGLLKTADRLRNNLSNIGAAAAVVFEENLHAVDAARRQSVEVQKKKTSDNCEREKRKNGGNKCVFAKTARH